MLPKYFLVNFSVNFRDEFSIISSGIRSFICLFGKDRIGAVPFPVRASPCNLSKGSTVLSPRRLIPMDRVL